MKRGCVPVTLSLPSELATKFEKLAKAEAKNKSQLFREMCLSTNSDDAKMSSWRCSDTAPSRLERRAS